MDGEERCDRCVFSGGLAGGAGQCRRYPPRFCPGPDDRGVADIIEGEWPIVRKDDWCGEFEVSGAVEKRQLAESLVKIND